MVAVTAPVGLLRLPIPTSQRVLIHAGQGVNSPGITGGMHTGTADSIVPCYLLVHSGLLPSFLESR